MERFRDDGHLTDEALSALIQQAPLGELERLEIAEHLAFCDDCLQRYTVLLADTPLLSPAQSCRETLWVRIRRRTIRLVTSRYATAAAAVVLALTLLWSGLRCSGTASERPGFFQEAGSAVSDQLHDFSQRWSDSFDGIFSRMSGFFDSFGGGRPQTNQGGINS